MTYSCQLSGKNYNRHDRHAADTKTSLACLDLTLQIQACIEVIRDYSICKAFDPSTSLPDASSLELLQDIF